MRPIGSGVAVTTEEIVVNNYRAMTTPVASPTPAPSGATAATKRRAQNNSCRERDGAGSVRETCGWIGQRWIRVILRGGAVNNRRVVARHVNYLRVGRLDNNHILAIDV